LPTSMGAMAGLPLPGSATVRKHQSKVDSWFKSSTALFDDKAHLRPII